MAVYNPLRPLRPRGQRRLAMSYLLPALAALNKEYDLRARRGSAAISGYTHQVADELAPLAGQTHGVYAGAEARQGADDAALANRLAALGIPEAGGAAAATAGFGSTALANLRARGAASEAYSRQLPGIARLAGVRHAGQFGMQIESERSTDASRLRQQLPSILQHIADQQVQTAIANIGLGAKQDALAESARGHTLSYKARMAAITAANKRTGMTLRERARHNQVSETEQARRDKVNAQTAQQRLRQQRRSQWYREQVGNWKRDHPNATTSALDAYVAGLKKQMKK